MTISPNLLQTFQTPNLRTFLILHMSIFMLLMETFVKFSNLVIRQQLYKKRAQLQGTGLWINENLNHSREILNYQARQLYKQGHLHKNWTFLGEVYIKIHKTNRPFKILTLKHLQFLVSQ